MAYVANKDETFGDAEHCNTLCGKPINDDKRQLQNKDQPSRTAGSKTPREQMQEILSNQRHIKLKKNAESYPTDEANFEEVLIEKMEQ